MHEQHFDAPRPNELTPQIREQLEKNEKAIERAIEVWTMNLQLLMEKIPHDDILLDGKSYTYNVAHGLILSRLNELLEAKQENDKLNRSLVELS
jgi:hypothetical protein